MAKKNSFSDIMGTVGNVASNFGTVGSVAGGLFGLFGGRKRAMDQQRELMDLQYEYQQRAAEAEYRRQTEMWEKNNAYNAPSAWRKRMEDANLLPAAMLGDGGSIGQATLGSSSTPSAPSPHAGLSTPGLDASMKFMQIAQGIAQIKNTESNTRLNDGKLVTENYQQKSLQAGAAVLAARVPQIDAETAIKQVEARIAAATETDRIEMSDTSAQASFEELRLLKQQYKNAVKDGRIKDAQFREISKHIGVMETQVLLMRAQTALAEMQENALAARIPYIAALIDLAEKDGTIKDFYINGTGEGYSPMQAEAHIKRAEASWSEMQMAFDIMYPGLSMLFQLLGMRPDSPRGKTLFSKIFKKKIPLKK